MKNKILAVCMLSISYGISAQETISYDNTNTWFTLLNRLNINPSWSVSNEIHERMGAFLSEQGTFLWRPSIDYHYNKNVEITIGYSLVSNKPNPPSPTPKIDAIENNIWEQVLITQDIGKVRFLHRFRQEHRWFDHIEQNADLTYFKNGTDFGNRFRYRFTVNTPLKTFKNNQQLFFQFFDEIWLPQTAQLMPKTMSRNWLYLGLGYKFSPKTNLQIGYMNQWDVIGNNTYISIPILQTTLVRNFDL